VQKKENHEQRNEEPTFVNLMMDYIWDRKAVVLLFLIQSVIFVAVCSLYQLHNLSKIMYAFVLSLFLWSCYGFFDAARYLQKRRRIQLAKKHPEQAVEALLSDSLQESFQQGN
jgi:hypothetical protein